jgi:alpha-mannosidase
VIFAAKVPSVGYAVYDVQPEAPARCAQALQVSENSLENEYYRVKLNSDGDVASIFDKSIGRELLAAPARLAISYDNPEHWPAWNMDWDQEQAAPKHTSAVRRKFAWWRTVRRAWPWKFARNRRLQVRPND